MYFYNNYTIDENKEVITRSLYNTFFHYKKISKSIDYIFMFHVYEKNCVQLKFLNTIVLNVRKGTNSEKIVENFNNDNYDNLL